MNNEQNSEISPEVIVPAPEEDFVGTCVVEFTADELRTLVSSLLFAGRELAEQFPFYQSLASRADEYFDLATRLDEEYEIMVAED